VISLTWRLVTQDDLASKAIQYISAGRASHVGLILPGGFELGARFDKAGGKPPGVQIRPEAYAKFESETYLTQEVTEEQGSLCTSFLFQQLGKPYDWRAIVGFAVNRNWRDDDSWICSELQAAAIEHAGICHPLYLAANKITPVGVALILSALGANITQEHP